MDADEPENHPKSLADILAEGLDDGASAAATQDESLEIKQAKFREVYARIPALEPGRSALCLSGGGPLRHDRNDRRRENFRDFSLQSKRNT